MMVVVGLLLAPMEVFVVAGTRLCTGIFSSWEEEKEDDRSTAGGGKGRKVRGGGRWGVDASPVVFEGLESGWEGKVG